MKLNFYVCCFLLISSCCHAKTDYYKYKCNSLETAEKVKEILEEQKFFIDFCSNCAPRKAAIRRIDIKDIEIKKKDCGAEVNVKGSIVRGIKPPVFAGYCTEEIEVHNPSQKLDLDYQKAIDLGYSYVWIAEDKRFETLSSVLDLPNKNICIKSLILKK
ncbi:MAG: hypothetical protein QNJ31_02590 [Candidatus Caenarcaniphilales bacterium]|nr:hypothetical protein [Candidatus Caenarcaniphilales bacterium]